MPKPLHEWDDIETLLAARAGDHEAGATLVRRHGSSMLRTAWNVVGRYGGGDAEDVVQEAFIAALTTGALPSGDLGAWLRSITARKALDWVRQHARRGESPLPEDRRAVQAGDPSVEVLALRTALATLSPFDRAVLTLVDLEGFSMAETARALASTTMAVKWRAVRARRKLRAAIEGAR